MASTIIPPASSVRRDHFQKHYLAWAALRHFLPAALLQELSEEIVRSVSSNRLELNDLFEQLVSTPDFLGFWCIQPIHCSSPIAEYLQQRVRLFIWENDGAVGIPQVGQTLDDIRLVRELEASVHLGQIDFDSVSSVSNDSIGENAGSANFLLHAIKMVALLRDVAIKPQILTILSGLDTNLPFPLNAAAAKHLGDLCADSDRWPDANYFYSVALDRLEKKQEPDQDWLELGNYVRSMIIQSTAASTRIIEGARPAALWFKRQLSSAEFKESPMLILNSAFDVLVASNLAREIDGFPEDQRASVLSPPLLLSDRGLSGAFDRWARHEYSDSHRQFWGVLRRQVALGSACNSRLTKIYYASSIFDYLNESIDHDVRPELFLTATRLTLESGDPISTRHIRWNEALVVRYVTSELISSAIASSRAYSGSFIERHRVLVQLFQKWAELLPPNAKPVAGILLTYVAQVASDHECSFFGERDLAGECLEALTVIGKKRPEFRRQVSTGVARATQKHLARGPLVHASPKALECATAYLDAMSEDDVCNVVESTFSLLRRLDPKSQCWPIVRPAISLLIAPAVKAIAKKNYELGIEVFATVVRFGLEQETEHSRLLFYLQDLPSASPGNQIDMVRLSEVVTSIRQKLNENSSVAVANIESLLVAPSVVGADGIRDAVAALKRILASVNKARTSISFCATYEILLFLSARYERTAQEALIDVNEFRNDLRSLVPLIVDVWKVAAAKPLIFAPFSIPPQTAPNHVVIHNWTFASIAFGRALGEEQAIVSAINAAAGNSLLRESISLAKAMRVTAGDPEPFQEESIALESRRAFYGALGGRLLAAHRLPAHDRGRVVRILLSGSLRLGPSGLDAGVFLMAIELGLGSDATANPEFASYERRVQNDSELRLALAPMLQELTGSRS